MFLEDFKPEDLAISHLYTRVSDLIQTLHCCARMYPQVLLYLIQAILGLSLACESQLVGASRVLRWRILRSPPHAATRHPPLAPRRSQRQSHVRASKLPYFIQH